MSLPTGTVESFPRGHLSARELRHLVDQHNQGVIDDHVVAAKLDADGGVGDTDYEAGLTALEIEYEGYSPTESAVKDQFGPFADPGQRMSERLAAELVEQMNARVNDEATLAAKLDGDAGVTFTTYGRAAGQVPHSVRSFADEDQITAVHRAESGDIYVGTTPGAGAGDPAVYRSRDDGRSWELVHEWSGHTGVSFIFEGRADVLFAGLDDAAQAVLYRSTDFGRHWSAIDTDAFDGYALFGGAVVESEGVYYVGAGDTDAAVFKSSDYGDTWTSLGSLQDSDETEVQVLLIADDGGLIAAAGGGTQVTIHRSVDGGGTFTLEHTQANHSAALDGIVTAAGTILIVGTAEAAVANVSMRSTDDGDTFGSTATGPTAATEAAIVQAASGRIYVGGDTDNQLHFSDDDGANWSAVNADHFANDTGIQAAVATRRGDVILGTVNATDGATVYLVPDFEPDPLTALGETPSGPGPAIYPGAGGGIHGDLQDALVELQNHLSVVWHSVTADLDQDGGVTDTDYEAQLSALALTRGGRTGRRIPTASR